MRDTYDEEKGGEEIEEKKKLEVQNGPDPKHPYVRRRLGCPCPALATMINHSYIIDMLKTHGVLEHDASISRWDAGEGDALNPDPQLVSNFLDSIDYPDHVAQQDKMITLDDYALRRSILEKDIIDNRPHQSMTKLHMLGIGEAVLAVKVFEDQRSILAAEPAICARSEWLREW
ncbi:uncharacterized protein MELLADRAFT_109753 [Melampsora larici-populina 98AG31]|uniref:Heme haloperoxidase family profile domain-containing protein n=1 Tax=Melampsora larici-populina (strain 98AG31 / pathotype 3-4-7) TaxID=747676 RepID=F4RXH7_MELLP|nr:uncharacterized protein MELLADRAFT_109753 [Melampsora larici-populina 98AG31]EGG02984.1 hypothetical protein MELLADRAFT_109753 [Melampsora larici-populina 98AG31]